MTKTLIETICDSLVDATKHAPSEVAPVAVLWTDIKGEWLPLIGLLRERLPQLLTYGEYDLEKRSGPSIWLKCVIERTLPDIEIPTELTPIIYIPEIGRQVLRAGSECPVELQPLVELLYRGTVWTQKAAETGQLRRYWFLPMPWGWMWPATTSPNSQCWLRYRY